MLQKIKNSPKNFWGIFALSLLLNVSFIPNLHAAPTDLDPSFGTGGVTQITFSQPSSYAAKILIQNDKIILGASTNANSESTYRFALARLNLSNGALDTSFGGSGKVETAFPDTGSPPMDGSSQLSSITVTPNGKIVAAGTFRPVSSVSIYNDNVALARYDSAGVLDPSFGTGGLVNFIGIAAIEEVNAVAMQGTTGDGKIIVAGNAADSISTAPIRAFSGRFGNTGALDSPYGYTLPCCTDGITAWPVNNANAVVVRPSDQHVFLAGNISTTPNDQMLVLHYTNEGQPIDPTTPNSGEYRIPFAGKNANAKAITLQADGKILVAGSATVSTGAISGSFALARLNADGSVDNTFGTMGKVETPFSKPISFATSIGLQSDGKIIVGGLTMGGSTPSASIALARYNANGTLDTSFGTGGKFETNVGNNSAISTLALQSDGKILLGGITASNADFNNSKAIVMRLMGGTSASGGGSPPGGGGASSGSGGGCNLSQLVTTTPWVNLIWVVGLLGFGILRRKSK